MSLKKLFSLNEMPRKPLPPSGDPQLDAKRQKNRDAATKWRSEQDPEQLRAYNRDARARQFARSRGEDVPLERPGRKVIGAAVVGDTFPIKFSAPGVMTIPAAISRLFDIASGVTATIEVLPDGFTVRINKPSGEEP